ncbi:histidine ammonia-lyase, partial [Pseudomonas sp. GW456-E7]
LQAVEYRGIEQAASYTKQLFQEMRKIVPSIQQDRVFSYDIERLTDWLKKESLLPDHQNEELRGMNI